MSAIDTQDLPCTTEGSNSEVAGSDSLDDEHDNCRQFYSLLHHGFQNSWFSFERDIDGIRYGAIAGCPCCAFVVDAMETHYRQQDPMVASVHISFRHTYHLPDEDGFDITLSLESSHPDADNSRWLLKKLEIFQLQGQEHKDLPATLRARSLPSEDTSSDMTFDTLQSWMTDCVLDHHSCATFENSKLPKRVLEIESTTVFLREDYDLEARYACLSHCWGPKGPTLKLQRANLTDLKCGLAIQDLPKTFRDAVSVCQKLDIRFLWIDALCIIQDDNDDWLHAAATMGGIYENSFLTIAATWAQDSDAGLFTPDLARFKARKMQSYGLYVREEPPPFPQPWERTEPWPLLTRAWVYQERLLSTRMLHYGMDQIYWECKFAVFAESQPTIIEQGRSSEVSQDPVRRWKKIVNEYSQLGLTYERDRLPAIGAIVEREMRAHPGDVYFAGMWKSDLLEYLTWIAGRVGNLRCRATGTGPTWSWPSTRASVTFFTGWSLMSSLQLMDVAFTPIGPEHIGDVKDASITLRGQIFIIRISVDADESGDETIRPEKYSVDVVSSAAEASLLHPTIGVRSSSTDYDWTSGDRPVRDGDIFDVMLIESCDSEPLQLGIMLRPVTERTFERMGTVTICHRTHTFSADEHNTEDYISPLPFRQMTIV